MRICGLSLVLSLLACAGVDSAPVAPSPPSEPAAPACTAGETRCEGAHKVASCVGGRWKVVENCKDHNQVCSFGAAMENGVMPPPHAFCTVADHGL